MVLLHPIAVILAILVLQLMEERFPRFSSEINLVVIPKLKISMQ